MDVCVYIKPGLSPMDRGDIEDAIIDAFGEGAEFVGGGTFFGEVVESDFQLALPASDDVDKVLKVCSETLQGFVFSQPTELKVTIGEESFQVEASVNS